MNILFLHNQYKISHSLRRCYKTQQLRFPVMAATKSVCVCSAPNSLCECRFPLCSSIYTATKTNAVKSSPQATNYVKHSSIAVSQFSVGFDNMQQSKYQLSGSCSPDTAPIYSEEPLFSTGGFDTVFRLPLRYRLY